jgi:hypothetical protein
MGEINLIKEQNIQAWSTKAKPPWTIHIHLKKNEGQEGKIRLFRGWVPVGGGWAYGKGEWEWICWMYFVFIYENRRLKPDEIVLRKGE